MRKHIGRVGLLIFVLMLSIVCPAAPARADTDFHTVDMRGVVNMGWEDEVAGDGQGGWTDQGDNDMRNVIPGRHEFFGIPFDLIDPAQNDGKAVLTLKSERFQGGLRSVTIPVGRKARWVYFLHATAWPEGTVAEYVIRYEDGSTQVVPIRAAKETDNWWSPEPQEDCRVAFRVRNRETDDVGMLLHIWSNPQRHKVIESIEVRSPAGSGAVHVLAAISLTDEWYPPDKMPDRGPLYMGLGTRDMDYRRALEEGRHDEIADQLVAVAQTPRGDECLWEFIRLLDRKEVEKYEALTGVLDRLDETDDLHADLTAADLVLKTVAALKGGPALREFPDAIMRRMASLLNHPDPVVQAVAEWAIALRVKKHNVAVTWKLYELMLPDRFDQDWYVKWQKRPPEKDLGDDYGRQLAHLNRHFTAAGLREEIEKVAGRIERMAAAPGARDASAAMERFRVALEAMRKAAGGEDLPAAHREYIAFRKAAREVVETARAEFPTEGFVFYTDAVIEGGSGNVNGAVIGRDMPVGGDIYVKHSADPAAPARASDIMGELGGGAIRGIDLDWDAETVLFSYWLKPIGDEYDFGWDRQRHANLYELNPADGQITPITDHAAFSDIEPCFLPDGGYVFASDRNPFGNQCSGAFLQNKRCTSLFRFDPRRSDRAVAISNNKDFDRHPHVLNDGTVAFLHWEYQERSFYVGQNLWCCRPDGTKMDAFFKQHIGVPYSMRDVQQAPDSDLCVATAQGHHDGQDGPVVLFDPTQGLNNEKAMWNVTPGTSRVEGGIGVLEKQIVAEGGVENRGGYYINPFPMSEKAFLTGHCMTENESDFGLYYIDVWGNKELIHRDKDLSSFMPHPLRKRTQPPVVADTVDPEAEYATAFVEDVYRDLPGVEKGAVKYLRISQRLFLPAPVDMDDEDYTYNHLHYLPGNATAKHFAHWTWGPTRTIGIVKVEDDGSAYFKVPAGTPVFFQALDENYCEVRRMRSFFTMQRGEFRGCMGCHETRAETAGTRPTYPKETLAKGPQTPEPPPWGINTVFDYRKHVQPVLDKHCVSCHGKDNPKAGLDFTAREIGGFAQSYRAMHGLAPDDATPVREMEWHLVLHPEATGDRFVAKKNSKGEYSGKSKAAGDIIEQMQQNEYPGMLVSISNRLEKTQEVTRPYEFGSNKSKLIRTLLDHVGHRKIRRRMTEDEWLRLVTWVDYNAPYHGTVINVRNYKDDQTLTRVPYYLPSPWIPADTNPLFYNVAEADRAPEMPENNDRMPD